MKTIKMPRRVEALLREIGRIAAARGVSAYAVGGCVRDWLLGRKGVVDIDVTVEGDGLEIARQAARQLGGALTEHQQFGTATLMIPQRPDIRHQTSDIRVDIATCRRETYAKPAAYPKVSRGTIHDDLLRRDFTINAMALAISPGRFGIAADPYRGRQDLRRKVLRVLHERSFLDDPSRILRGIRFAQRFGLRWEKRTERAAREAVAAGALGWLNAGRLGKELDRMGEEPDPRVCFEALATLLDRAAPGSWPGPLPSAPSPEP